MTEYITLNAYNKKTSGGGLVNLALRKLTGEKDEFEIKLDNIINNYNQDISNKIAIYLKKQRLIHDSNNKIWIITEFNKTNKNSIKVKGYTTIDEFLIKYGTDNYKKTFNLYIKNHPNEMISFNDENVNKPDSELISHFNMTYLDTNINNNDKILLFNNISLFCQNSEIYNNFVLLIKQQYNIYCILENLNSLIVPNEYKIESNIYFKDYTINEYYKLCNDTIFKCTKYYQLENTINNKPGLYTIIFKFCRKI